MIVLLVGLVTCIGGIVLVLRHLHLWRARTDATSNVAERKFLWQQLRRRTLTSTCITVLGFIISLFHFREYWRDRPTSWMILVCCALVLVLMIFVLASLDILAVSNAIRNEKSRTSDAAQELAREYHRLKNKTSETSSEKSSENAAD